MSGRKLALMLIVATVTICVIGVRLVGRMYPTLAVLVTISVALMIGLVHQNIVLPRWGLIVIVVLSTFYRSFLFVYPASFIGADSDRFAFAVERVLQTSHASDFMGALGRFYPSAPNYPIFGSISSLVAGLPVRYALIIIPVIIGVLVPLVAYIVAYRLDFHPEVGVLAAALTTVIPAVLSPNLLAQSLATPIAMTIAVLVLVGNVTRRSETLLTAVLLFTVLLYTHKLAPALLTGSFVIIEIINIGRSRLLGQQYHLMLTGLDFVAIFGVLFYLQWEFTNIGYTVVNRTLTVITGLETEAQAPVLTELPSGAQPLFESSLFPTFLNIGYLIPLLVLAGIGWILVAFRQVNKFEDSTVLGLVVIPVALTIGTVFSVVPDGPPRYFFFAVPFVAALSAITIDRIAAFASNSQVSFVVVVILLLILTVPQAFARGPPDSPGERRFLTAPEIAAQEWVNQRIEGPVATDGFYSREPSPSLIKKYAKKSDDRYYDEFNFKSATIQLLNSSVNQGQDCHFAVRQSANVYRLAGQWRMTYDLDIVTKKEEKIYSSGGYGTEVGKQRNCRFS